MSFSVRRSFVAALAVGFSEIIMSGCKIKQVESEPEPPARPARVPDKAVWAGGVDGGSFILLESTPKADRYAARIYDDRSGEVIFDGVLSVDQGTAVPLDVKDPKVFGFWDGDTLYLRDGRSLSPHAK